MRDYFNWFLFLLVGLPLVVGLEVMLWVGGRRFSDAIRVQHANYNLRKVEANRLEGKRRKLRELGRNLAERERKAKRTKRKRK